MEGYRKLLPVNGTEFVEVTSGKRYVYILVGNSESEDNSYCLALSIEEANKVIGALSGAVKYVKKQ